jgi:hypothetical protein
MIAHAAALLLYGALTVALTWPLKGLAPARLPLSPPPRTH